MDYESLRYDLIEYFGTAAGFNPMAYVELSIVESASNDVLISIALKNGFDLSDYEIQKTK